MSVINILPPHVADLIAAGEVVERPASVVKELMENSIDAGAKSLTVEIRDGGRSLIRVTDDGIGMSPDDAGLAFSRHATSKLNTGRDLESIATLGFRGEALAAIAAVSRVELTTRKRGDSEGACVVVEAGDIMEIGSCGCPEGTDFTVRDLFYNTPARLKFMKNNRAEGQACALAALRTALSRPDVSVRLIRDGGEDFFSPGDGRTDSAVYSILGRDMAAGLIKTQTDDNGVRVTGFVSAPYAVRGNRAQQYFFCNGRYIKSKTLQAALEGAYKNSLPHGRFPACVLYLELDPAAIDVNVHPAKTEVKFSDERRVFDGVYYAVLGAITSADKTAEILISPGTRAKAKSDGDFYKSMSAGEFKKTYADKASAPAPSEAVRHTSALPLSDSMKPRSQTSPLRDSAASAYTKLTDFAAPRRSESELSGFSGRTEPDIFTAPAQSEPDTPDNQPRIFEPAGFRIIGEAMDVYIIVESGGELMLIDKHAAHERVIFDSLKGRGHKPMPQTLLVPVTLTPGAEGAELLLENEELLSDLGFDVSPYGEGSVILRAVPSDTDEADALPMLEDILDKLSHGHSGIENSRDGILYTVACKAAIKAGRRSEPEELTALAEKVVSGEVKYCPHGRPVAVRLTKAELDRQFKRTN